MKKRSQITSKNKGMRVKEEKKIRRKNVIVLRKKNELTD